MFLKLTVWCLCVSGLGDSFLCWDMKQNFTTSLHIYEWMNQSHTVLQTFQICSCLCVPMFKALGHDGVWGSRLIAPCIFNVGTKWGWVVFFTPRSLYPRGEMAAGRFGEDINLLLLPGIERRFLGCPVRSLVTVPSELSLHISMKNNTLYFCSVLLY